MNKCFSGVSVCCTSSAVTNWKIQAPRVSQRLQQKWKCLNSIFSAIPGPKPMPSKTCEETTPYHSWPHLTMDHSKSIPAPMNIYHHAVVSVWSPIGEGILQLGISRSVGVSMTWKRSVRRSKKLRRLQVSSSHRENMWLSSSAWLY